jgi:hypothetical protein
MQDKGKGYSTIQKLIKLLEKEHLEFFRDFLLQKNALLSVKLIDSIEPGFSDQTQSDDLCKIIYGKSDTRAKSRFNQLASHTFKLSYYLSQNFPGYLMHNISKLEILLANQKVSEALTMAGAILEIGEKICNFQVQAEAYKFLAQYARIRKADGEIMRYLQKAKEMYTYENQINELYIYLHQNFNITLKDDSILQTLEKHLNYFKEFHRHPQASIRLLSFYFTVYLIYYHKASGVNTPDVSTISGELIQELEKGSIVTFPVLEDLCSKLFLLRLNHSEFDLTRKDHQMEMTLFKNHFRNIHFWHNFNHLPKLYSLAIRATSLLSKYHHQLHKIDFYKIIPNQVKQITQSSLLECKDLLGLYDTGKLEVRNFIDLKLTEAVFLMHSSKKEMASAMEELEILMTSYQQSSFSASLDTIFSLLLIGYFSLGNYLKCIDTYNRYLKLINGRVINEENHLEIRTYYYCAQWINQPKRQYLNKLIKNLEQAQQHKSAARLVNTIKELSHYFSIPLEPRSLIISNS